MYQSKQICCEKNNTLYCREYGAGAPILMIHGVAVDSHFFHDTATILSQHYRIFTYDRRGYGESSAAEDGDYSVSAHVRDAQVLLRDIVREAGMPCHIIASSAGCSIAMELAVRCPDLIDKLLLYEPAVADCLPADDPIFDTIAEAQKSVAKGLYTEPLFTLFSCEYLGDERARESTPEELKNKDRNASQYLLREFPGVFFFKPDYEGLKKFEIFIGLGERSQNTYHARSCPELCQRTGARMVAFPGGHNCPFDLPLEFACLADGLLRANNLPEGE